MEKQIKSVNFNCNSIPSSTEYRYFLVINNSFLKHYLSKFDCSNLIENQNNDNDNNIATIDYLNLISQAKESKKNVFTAERYDLYMFPNSNKIEATELNSIIGLKFRDLEITVDIKTNKHKYSASKLEIKTKVNNENAIEYWVKEYLEFSKECIITVEPLNLINNPKENTKDKEIFYLSQAETNCLVSININKITEIISKLKIKLSSNSQFKYSREYMNCVLEYFNLFEENNTSFGFDDMNFVLVQKAIDKRNIESAFTKCSYFSISRKQIINKLNENSKIITNEKNDTDDLNTKINNTEFYFSMCQENFYYDLNKAQKPGYYETCIKNLNKNISVDEYSKLKGFKIAGYPEYLFNRILINKNINSK